MRRHGRHVAGYVKQTGETWPLPVPMVNLYCRSDYDSAHVQVGDSDYAVPDHLSTLRSITDWSPPPQPPSPRAAWLAQRALDADNDGRPRDLLAADPVVVTVQVTAVARLTSEDRRGASPSSGGAVGVGGRRHDRPARPYDRLDRTRC